MYFIASFSFLLLLCIESTYSHFSCVCIDVKTFSFICTFYPPIVINGLKESSQRLGWKTTLRDFRSSLMKFLNYWIVIKQTVTKPDFYWNSRRCRTVHVLTVLRLKQVRIHLEFSRSNVKAPRYHWLLNNAPDSYRKSSRKTVHCF